MGKALSKVAAHYLNAVDRLAKSHVQEKPEKIWYRAAQLFLRLAQSEMSHGTQRAIAESNRVRPTTNEVLLVVFAAQNVARQLRERGLQFRLANRKE